MNPGINLENVYVISDNFVSREIEDELIIVPISGGVGDLEEGLFSLNDTGKAIWNLLDPPNTVIRIIEQLHESFSSPDDKIIEDVKGFLSELLKRGMILEQKE